MRHAHCQECGKATQSARKPKTFCSSDCRIAFNNRRAQRGQVVYDLFMAMRYERKLAKALQLFNKLCRYGELCRDEDKEAGRGKTWRDPRAVLQGRADLSASTMIKKR